MTAADLARALDATLVGADVEVGGIAVDSRSVRAGDLFVVQQSARNDGARFVADARRVGAVAACAATAIAGLPTPIVVADPRVAAPRLAAAFFGHPARELTLFGITGTLGKTSTALLIESALAASGVPVGVIGSLGVRIGDRVVDTGMTTPDAPAIHAALRAMADAGVRMAAMEITSHGIAQRRVAGLTFALGVFTNLARMSTWSTIGPPKTTCAPKRASSTCSRTVHPWCSMPTRQGPGPRGARPQAASASRDRRVRRGHEGRVGARHRTPERRGRLRPSRSRSAPSCLAWTAAASSAAPCRWSCRCSGGTRYSNAALAATAALVAGASPEAITEAVAEQAPIPRRMEIVRTEAPVVVDDTVGNPRTLAAVFESIAAIPHRGLRIVFGIRGSRGVEINSRLGTALATLVAERTREVPVRLVVTASIDAAGSRDRVGGSEGEGLLAPLRAAAVAFDYEPTLAAAVGRALEGSGAGDLVLLLGAQGMDRAAELARSRLP